MLILISPAKTLDFESELKTQKFSTPRFVKESSELVGSLVRKSPAELEKLINRRGPQWWDSAIRKGSRVSVLVFGDRIAGYANYGRNRARSLHFEGEIYELYLRPEFQGLGFGRRLFAAARRDLMQSGLKTMVIWALSDNEPATEFYRALGGRMVARSSERFGPKSLDKVAFAWAN